MGAGRDLLIRRVTAEGGWREMSLLRSRIGDQAIRDVIERTEARGLTPQRIRFWQLVLGLPATQSRRVGPARAGVDLGAQGAPVRLKREALGRSQRLLLPASLRSPGSTASTWPAAPPSPSSSGTGARWTSTGSA